VLSSAFSDIVFGFPRLPASFEKAALLIDKPPGWSSFDVIRKLRGLLSIRKIGHAGTLDPMASGLLICLTGKATKLMLTFQDLDKEYIGIMRLGEETRSYDAESEVIHSVDCGFLTIEDVAEKTSRYIGEIEQKPPMFSAVKVGGERLYKKARRGESIDRPTRKVFVHAFSIIEKSGPDVSFSVRCSKGTYIRSLAHDIGQDLGVGAHLISLRRVAIGPYNVEDAWQMDVLAQKKG